MSEKKTFPIVPASSTSISRCDEGSEKLLSRMSSGVLAAFRDRANAPQQDRFRVGDFEFRAPDYQQILLWAAASGFTPERVVDGLSKNWSIHLAGKGRDHPFRWKVVDGQIIWLIWEFDEIPIKELVFVGGLNIEKLVLFSQEKPAEIPSTLPDSVQELVLDCRNVDRIVLAAARGLKTINIEAGHARRVELLDSPELEELRCSCESLAAIVIQSAPKLKLFVCADSEISELDLSGLSALEELDCSGNHLVKLNLSGALRLQKLNCQGNRLTNLDLSGLSNLETLTCSHNELSELDISHTPRLTELDCFENQIIKIKVPTISRLEMLDCSDNLISEISLVHFPDLAALTCSNNRITTLDIRLLRRLQILFVDSGVRITGMLPKVFHAR